MASALVIPGSPLLGSALCGDITAALAALAGSTAATIASAATVDLGSVATLQVIVSGSVTITSFGSNANLLTDQFKWVRFTGAPRVTYNATSLITPTGVNIDAKVGDLMLLQYLGSGNWRVLVWWPALAGGASRACFLGHKNGNNQTGIVPSTFTLITWSAEDFDIGGYFSSDKWTPPAGKVLLNTQVFTIANVVDGFSYYVSIYKNGARIIQSVTTASNNSQVGSRAMAIADANGTDYFEVYAYLEGAGNKTLDGSSFNTYFMGTML